MTSTIVYDADVYKEFEKLVGAGNVSDEIRAMMEDRVNQSKKEEGLLTPNPLNLHVCDNPRDNNNRQETLFEYFPQKDVRNDICKFLDEKDDMVGLETLYRNCNTVVKVIDTKKRRNAVMGEVQRKQGIPSNEEILTEIKRAKRGIPL